VNAVKASSSADPTYVTRGDLFIKIKFPFKRNGLPCCEDEPGSEKIALK